MLDILDLCIPWGSLVLIDEVRGSGPWNTRSDAGLRLAMNTTWPCSITYHDAGGDAARATDEE